MDYRDYVATCIGCFQNRTPELIADNFNVSYIPSEQDVKDMIQRVVESRFRLSVDYLIIVEIFRVVVEKAVRELGFDKNKFSWYVNIDESHLYYDGQEMFSWDDLETLCYKLELFV